MRGQTSHPPMSFVIEARVDSVGETVHGALLDQRHHKDDEEDEGEEEAYVGTTIVKVLRPTRGMNE